LVSCNTKFTPLFVQCWYQNNEHQLYSAVLNIQYLSVCPCVFSNDGKEESQLDATVTVYWQTQFSSTCFGQQFCQSSGPFFCSAGATTHCGFVFYSPLVGFSLLAYEVSWSHTTRHIR